MITDEVRLSSRTVTDEGFLNARASVTCVGVQRYTGSELMDCVDGLDASKLYNVYRPADVVFHDATLKSLPLKPVTINHPINDVDSSNYRNNTIGVTGEKVDVSDGENLLTNITIFDGKVVDRVLKDGSELSLGYDVDIEKRCGEYKGEKYSLCMNGPMIVNHLALVEKGRCGNNVKILDGVKKMFKKSKDKKSLNDLNMEALLSKVSDRIMPDIQKLISSEEFLDNLANRISEKFMKEYEEGVDEVVEEVPSEGVEEGTEEMPVTTLIEADTPTSEVAAEEEIDAINSLDEGGEHRKVSDSKKSLKKVVDNLVDRKLEVMNAVKSIAKGSIDTVGKSEKQLLMDSLKSYYPDENLDTKSRDYLLGLAKNITVLRDSARRSVNVVNGNAVEPMNYMQIRKFEKNSRG